VSHDRYLIERVTDQQYAVLDGRMRHLPGGVDEYLRLRAAADSAGASRPAEAAASAGLSGAERRAAEKELASVERRMAKVAEAISAQHAAFAVADQSDYGELQRLQAALAALEAESAELEERWLVLGQQLES
jgi:ATPase subunit of ABC transporter with duplicated ATPase domains